MHPARRGRTLTSSYARATSALRRVHIPLLVRKLFPPQDSVAATAVAHRRAHRACTREGGGHQTGRAARSERGARARRWRHRPIWSAHAPRSQCLVSVGARCSPLQFPRSRVTHTEIHMHRRILSLSSLLLLPGRSRSLLCMRARALSQRTYSHDMCVRITQGLYRHGKTPVSLQEWNESIQEEDWVSAYVVARK